MNQTIKKIIMLEDDKFLIFECPHCDMGIAVKKTEINCCIFRCAILKDTLQQINPHTNKEECDRLKKEDLIFGCSYPFKIIIDKDEKYVVKCDYI